MAASLSLDLRERISDRLRAGDETHGEIASRFQVSISTVERISSKIRKGRPLKTAPRSGRPPALMEEHIGYLRALLKDEPFLSSYEVAARFVARFPDNRVHRSTILRAMHGLGLSYKKKHRTRRSETAPT
jgi:transposase